MHCPTFPCNGAARKILSEVDVKNLRHVLSVVGEKLSDEEWRELQKELPVENGKVLHHSGDTEIAYLIIRRKTLN